MTRQTSCPFHVVNSFTREAFAGNPAGVVLLTDELDTALMQSIARQINLIETVFICGGDGTAIPFHFRYFTPQKELPIAGHPTIAALWSLQLQGHIRRRDRIAIQTGAGLITAWFNGDQIWVVQPEAKFTTVSAPIAAVADVFGLASTDFCLEPGLEVSDTGLGHLIVELQSLQALERARVLIEPLAALCQAYGAREAQLFTAQSIVSGCQLTTRNLCPREGAEDPACGSGNAALGAWLARHKRLNSGETIWIRQGDIVNRPAEIGVAQREDGHIAIGGYAKAMATGTLCW